MAIQSSSSGSKSSEPRLVAPEASVAETDGGRDAGLRPRRLSDYIGQHELKQVKDLLNSLARWPRIRIWIRI